MPGCDKEVVRKICIVGRCRQLLEFPFQLVMQVMPRMQFEDAGHFGHIDVRCDAQLISLLRLPCSMGTVTLAS
jgi:hypothetical protein